MDFREEECVVGEQNLEAVAFKVTANCQVEGTDTQETVNNWRDTHPVEKNPKIYWTFKDEKLKISAKSLY